MIELTGKFNSAKVFTDIIDQASVAQIIELCSQEFTIGEKIRMMPDVHAGMGCVIGTTMTITDKIVPNLVGVDIGCGMETIKIKEKHIELMQLDKLIYSNIPSGFAIRSKPHKYVDRVDVCSLNVPIKSISAVPSVPLELLEGEIILLKPTRAVTAVSILSSILDHVTLELRLQNIIRSRDIVS